MNSKYKLCDNELFFTNLRVQRVQLYQLKDKILKLKLI